MIDVLFVCSKTPPMSVVADTLDKLNAEGARVVFGGLIPSRAAREHRDELDFAETHDLVQAKVRRAVQLPRGEQVWLRVRSDSWLRERARKAGVLVALDEQAVYTVWQLAQRNRTAKAVYGFAPAVNAVRELKRTGVAPSGSFRPPLSLVARDGARAVRRLPDATARLVTARPIMRRSLGERLWRLPLRVPGVPTGLRVPIGRRVAEALNWAGRRGGATYTLVLTASKVSDPALKAELLETAVNQDYQRGIVPPHLDTAVQALLDLADLRQSEGRYEEAARNLRNALLLTFHRVAHIDGLTSPLTADPGRFVKRIHSSRAMQTVMTPRGRLRPAAPPPADRPLRLLLTTNENANFLRHIIHRYDAHPDVEVRYLDVASEEVLKKVSRSDQRVMQERMGGDDAYAAQLEQLMRPHLDWADTVFLDWCAAPATALTNLDPGDTRIIIRLHSYEAFTRFPHMVDFSRVDDLVFVADHVQDLTTSLVPQLRGPHAPRMHVLHNAMDLGGFAREKTPDARFNLGLVGIGQVAKDPLWALEVLRRLRERDDRYRLLLVGGDMNPRASRASKKYSKQFEEELEPLVEAGAVLRLGPTDDVAGKLTDIGFILSTSVREGCHVGLMEGAASGAVPVVRDWPFYAGKAHSARTLYPEGWVLDTPEAAAQRVLQVNVSEESWLDHSRLAAKYAQSTWDWSVVSADFDRLFLGEQR
ncbi:hypothetical protein K3N28_06830 [Glycomyces sp. TRM65418]|uniref:hypothetical protein n=1 Tax=Glycomyces sp. TRM65418 TaxID=2867006 RepID=UPI001CE628B7|nr:hypothetical protein [Glycomyces sp. TRM65418]MCC3762785.1 hypothetical protein [Glycomyces sp. TRM65418]QZD56815.1 hypothetical protein K3N28_06780 [Glycomyces sp. TRM65418]